ncbi:hypothetical protein AB4428_14880, partial [Vibrio lentus]
MAIRNISYSDECSLCSPYTGINIFEQNYRDDTSLLYVYDYKVGKFLYCSEHFSLESHQNPLAVASTYKSAVGFQLDSQHLYICFVSPQELTNGQSIIPENPVLSLIEIDRSILVKELGESPNYSSVAKDSLNSLISTLPSVASAVHSISSDAVQLVFKPEVAEQLANGTATVLSDNSGSAMCVAIGPDGKIIGQARQIPVSKLPAIGAASFQILSVVVAQSHLVDIKRKLKSIESKIEYVNSFINDQFKSTLTSHLIYLTEFSQDLSYKRLSESELSARHVRLEAIYSDALKAIDFCKNSIRRNQQIVESIKAVDTFGSASTRDELKSKLKDDLNLFEQAALSHSLITLVYILRAFINPRNSTHNENLNNWQSVGSKEIPMLMESYFRGFKDKTDKLLSKVVFTSRGFQS